jgi:asparagine synthetase B (glutamine-hydrolysing)
MTGVVGIVSHGRDTPVTEDDIDQLTSAYESLRGAGKRSAACAGSFARVATICATSGGGCSHAMAGAAMPGAASADARLPRSAGSSWVILTGTPHDPSGSGGADLQALDGQFTWASYDAPRDELSVATDPFGMQALYLAERRGRTYFSTSALALAKHLRARPSELGLGMFLRAGYQFGSVTNWEGIERLDPGTCVSFTARGPERRIYWRPTVDEAVARMGLAEAAEHCRSVTTSTLRSHLRGRQRGWADLTGGYDSRLLALLLAEAGVDFAANTVGRENDLDVRIAAQVANTAGWEWSRFDIPSSWREILPGLIPLSVAWGDCHLDVLQLAEVLWGHLEKAGVHPSLLGGGGGEHFRGFAWQQEFLRAGRSTEVNLDNWIDMRLLKPVSTQIFAHDPTPELREHLRARMAAYAAPYSSHRNTTQLDVLYAYKITGHFGAYASAASGAIGYELPFYFKPVFSVAFSTSHRHRTGHRLMRRMIAALDPRVAALSTADGGPAEPPRLGNLHRFTPYYRTIARKAVNKISERLLERPLLLPRAASDPVRAGARAAFVDGLEEGGPLRAETMRSGPMFKRNALNDLLSRAEDPSLKDAAMLGRVLTVELALRTVDAALDS